MPSGLLELAQGSKERSCCISEDEQVVCIWRMMPAALMQSRSSLGCSVGKGNLLFHMRENRRFLSTTETPGSLCAWC